MRLFLYVWAEDFKRGIFISSYYSWAEIVDLIKIWATPAHVYTVVEGDWKPMKKRPDRRRNDTTES